MMKSCVPGPEAGQLSLSHRPHLSQLSSATQRRQSLPKPLDGRKLSMTDPHLYDTRRSSGMIQPRRIGARVLCGGEPLICPGSLVPKMSVFIEQNARFNHNLEKKRIMITSASMEILCQHGMSHATAHVLIDLAIRRRQSPQTKLVPPKTEQRPPFL